MGKIKKIISLEKATKIYNKHIVPVVALKNATFSVNEGEFIAIMGPSGSGKSTLLHILGLLDTATKGKYEIQGIEVSKLPESVKSYFRLTQLGYVFQEYALIDEMTALGNVYLGLLMNGKKIKEAKEIAKKALDEVGLEGKYDRVQSELSGGERQRVAIARAIASSPSIIFADEPCANLDTHNSEQVLELFKSLNKKLGITIIMVTHEDWHKKFASRLIELKDGKIVGDRKLR